MVVTKIWIEIRGCFHRTAFESHIWRQETKNIAGTCHISSRPNSIEGSAGVWAPWPARQPGASESGGS